MYYTDLCFSSKHPLSYEKQIHVPEKLFQNRTIVVTKSVSNHKRSSNNFSGYFLKKSLKHYKGVTCNSINIQNKI